ncbi:DUF4157 domain-containing protein [Nocardia colli]|uniref:DUF4157 domain-containing protein n=1 Tax=Nocardia colli TaxID=2545717 RepID=A0A5N0E7S7_9NOCA|nr:DUF4157 domain-containing protein [Nocardia colli]KAA8884205.1 DUF4157 domain-containing protein [Nocardia colli]
MTTPANQHRVPTRALRQPPARSESAHEPEHNSSTPGFGIDLTTVPAVANGLDGPGTPLDPHIRAAMESRFGHDFSDVRTHTGPAADTSARAMRARAYTLGTDLVFREGTYRPGTPSGDHVLAHELAHVVQQSRALPCTSAPVSAMEHDAHRAADDWSSGDVVRVTGQSSVQVACLDEDEPLRDGGANGAPASATAGPPRPPQAPEPGVGVVLTDEDNQKFARERKAVDVYVKYSEQALDNQSRTGVPALVTLGQMVLESGWTPDKSASYFGVKGDPKAGPDKVVWLSTPEPVTAARKLREMYGHYPEFAEGEIKPGAETYQVTLPFRRYANVADAIDDHSRVLGSGKYSKAWQNPTDPEQFGRAIAAAGYSAGDRTKYSADLVSIMQTLNKAAAYARQNKKLDPVRQMIDVLKVSKSPESYEQARRLIPQAIPGFEALPAQSRLPKLRELENRLINAGQPPDVAAKVCQP